MSDKNDKGGERGILARTATFTTKRARRAHEKFMQKVGKSDETKDDIFDEFVNNFNKQQASAARLSKELRNYLECLSSMQVATNAFAEAVKEVYELDWVGRDRLCNLFDGLENNFKTLRRRMNEEVIEPLNSYQKPFNDVKGRISKRSRKLVDYDHCRHIVDTLRAKGTAKSSDAKKLSQAESDYQKSKEVFVDLTSDLYDELPALYDSRIGFYVSCFQSIFTLEAVFHREAAKMENQLNDLMDQLIADVSSGTYSTRKPYPASREGDSSDTDRSALDSMSTNNAEGSLATFYDVAVPDERSSAQNSEGIAGSSANSSDEDRLSPVGHSEEVQAAEEVQREGPPERPSIPPAAQEEGDECQGHPQGLANGDGGKQEEESTESEGPKPSDSGQLASAEPEREGRQLLVYKNEPSDDPNQCHLTVPGSIYKVIATHHYAAEDDDELSFEKGEVIHVIEFEEPDEQDEGWLMGVMDTTGLKGVFPENFTKRLS